MSRFNLFDKIGNWLNESLILGGQEGALRHALKGMYAVDSPISSAVSLGNPKNQLEEQAEFTLLRRNLLFDRVDVISNHHLATTIKDIIISDGFNDLNNKNMLSIRYTKDNGETDKVMTEEIQKMLDKTKLISILKDCITNEGMDYGEIFLSTECKIGYGIEKIHDDLDLRQHIAIYKNTKLIGVLKFEIAPKGGRVIGKEFIKPENVSHFMINYKKIPIKITKNFNKRFNIPEKIRCALPILTPVIDLIMQYNQLEQIRTAIEINRATQPVVMGIGVSPDQDMTEVGRQLQELSISLNSNKNAIINNLDTLDVFSILQSMQQIQLIPYNQEEGTGSMKQVTVTYGDGNLSEKLNDLKKSIALAVGVPEQYVAAQTYVGAKDTKEDSLLTNPRYSSMLTKMQGLLTEGLIELIYKHLKVRYSNEQGIITKKIDKNKIEVLFNSTTELNDRLEDESMLLNAETVANLVNVIETIASSPNIPMKVRGEQMLEVWKKELYRNPTIANVFELMTPEEQMEYNNNNNVLGMGGEPGAQSADFNPTSNIDDMENDGDTKDMGYDDGEKELKTKKKTKKKSEANDNSDDIRDIFK